MDSCVFVGSVGGLSVSKLFAIFADRDGGSLSFSIVN